MVVVTEVAAGPVRYLFGGGGEKVGWLRRVTFWATAAMWEYCLTTHLLVVAGLSPPIIDPLIVGAVHGLAGSGALTALVMATIPSMAARLIYLVLFGVGSTARSLGSR